MKNVYETRELSRKATVAKNATVQKEAGRQVRRIVEYYNLDAILSVGYRVNSKRGTQFRIWATQTLKEHLVRGYTLNRQRFEENAQELEAALSLIREPPATVRCRNSPRRALESGDAHACRGGGRDVDTL